MQQERVWLIATRIAVGLVAVLFAVLVATGIVLTFRYQPDVTYANVAHHGSSGVTARGTHRLAATLFLPAVAFLVLASIGLCFVRRRIALAVLPVLAAALAVVAGVTGYLLPWDQLAVRATAGGVNIKGYGSILRGDRVTYVLVGARTISTATFSRWFWLHAVVVPVAIVAVLVAIAITMRRSRRDLRSHRPDSS